MSLYLYLIRVLAITSRLVSAETVRSNATVADHYGTIFGARIELSGTVLRTGDSLHYICREDVGYANNGLQRYQPDQIYTAFGEQVPDTKIIRKSCQMDDLYWQCTETSGSVLWQKELAGNYSCRAFPEHNYYIHWINPYHYFAVVPGARSLGPSVTVHRELSFDVVGHEVKLVCSLNIAPVNISYREIISPDWAFSKANDQFTDVPPGVMVNVEGQGPHMTATIARFSLTNHPGSYKCSSKVVRYSPPLLSAVIVVSVYPKAELRNNRWNKFTLDVDDEVTFTCFGWSSPPPDSITVSIDSLVLSADTNGVTFFRKQNLTAASGIELQFKIRNVGVVFKDGSNLKCEVASKLRVARVTQQIHLNVAHRSTPTSHRSINIHQTSFTLVPTIYSTTAHSATPSNFIAKWWYELLVLGILLMAASVVIFIFSGILYNLRPRRPSHRR